MDAADITAIATAANLAKIDQITNLTLTDGNTADAATIDRLLASDAVRTITTIDLAAAKVGFADGKVYTLTVDQVVLTFTDPVDDTRPATVAEIVAGLSSGANSTAYGNANFTLSASGDVITITYKEPGTAIPTPLSFAVGADVVGTPVSSLGAGANVIATDMSAAKLNAIAVGIDAVIMNKITGVMSLNQGVLEANIPALFTKYLGAGDDQALVNAQGMAAGQLIEVSEGIAEVQTDGITNLTINKDVIASDRLVATGTVGGDNGGAGPAVQTIAIGAGVLQQGDAYTLVLDGARLSVTLNGATPSVDDLVAAFEALDNFAGAGVTLTANANTMTITYSANGAKAPPEFLINAGDDGHIGRLLSKAVDDAVTVDITGMDNHQIEAVRDSVIKVGTMLSDKATIFEAVKTYWTIDGGQLTVDALGGGTIKIFTQGTPDVDITDKFIITPALPANSSITQFITYTATLKPGENLGPVQPTLVIKYLRDINGDGDFLDQGETVTPTYIGSYSIIQLPLVKPHVAALIDSLETDILTVNVPLTVKEAASLDIHNASLDFPNDGLPKIVYDVLDSIAAIQAVLDAGDPLRLLRDATKIDLTGEEPEALADRLDIPASLAGDLYGKFPVAKADWINISPDLTQTADFDSTFTYVEVGTTAKALSTLNIAVDDLDIQGSYTGAGNITKATIAITSGGRATDLLAFDNQGGIFTTTYTVGTNLVVTVVDGQEANATAAAWSAMLNSLTFRSTSDQPNVIAGVQNITTNTQTSNANDPRTIDFAGVEVVVGGEYKVSLAGNTFSYTAKAVDTLATIVDKLASIIHASPSYTAQVLSADQQTILQVGTGAGNQLINVVGIAGTRTLEITVEDGADARSAAKVVSVAVEPVNDQPTINYTISGTPREDYGYNRFFSSFTLTENELEKNFNGGVLQIQISGGRSGDSFRNNYNSSTSGAVYAISNGNWTHIGNATQSNGTYTVVFNQNATPAAVRDFAQNRLDYATSYQPLTDGETETREISVSFVNGRTTDYSGTPYTIDTSVGSSATINGITQQAPVPVVKDFTVQGTNDEPVLTSATDTNNPTNFTIYDNRSESLDPSLDRFTGFVSDTGIRAGTNPDDPGEVHLVRGTDIDISHTSLGIYVHNFNSSGGTWQVSLNNGVSWANLGTGVHYANSAYIRFVQNPDAIATSINDAWLRYGASDGIAVGGFRDLYLNWQPTDATLFPNMQDINNPRFLVDAVEIINDENVLAPVFKSNTFSTNNALDRIIVGLGLDNFVAKFDNLSTQGEAGNSSNTNFDGKGNVITGLSVSRAADIANSLRDATLETGPVVALLWNSNAPLNGTPSGLPARMELWVDYRSTSLVDGETVINYDPKLVAIFGGTNFDNLGDMESFGWQDFVIVNAGSLPHTVAETTKGNAATNTEEVQTITIAGNPNEIVISGVNGATNFTKVLVLQGLTDAQKATVIQGALNAADAFNTKVTSVTYDAGSGSFVVTFDDDLGDVLALSVVTANPTGGNTLGNADATTDQILFGHQGNDILNGGKGSDILVGGSGDDVITSGAGRDVVYGGAGNDIITLGSGGDFADGGAGNDTITSGLGNDLIIGNLGDDIINLSPARAEGTAATATINVAGALVGDDRTITLGTFTVLAGATYSVSIGNAAKAASMAIAGLTTNAVNSIENFNLQLNGQLLTANLNDVTDLASLTTAINNIAGISATSNGFTLTITADDTSAPLSLVTGKSVFTNLNDVAAVGTGGATIIPPKAAMTDFTTFSYTATEADATAGVNAVATGLAAAINANSAYTANATTPGTVTVTEGAGLMAIRFDAPLSGSDTVVFGIDANQNGFDVISGFETGPLEWGGDRIMFVDFSTSPNDSTLIKGAFTNTDLRGNGLFAEKLGEGGTIGANTGFVLFTGDLGDFTTGGFGPETALDLVEIAAEALIGEGANDVLYLLGSDGTDAVLTRVIYSNIDDATVELLARFEGMNVAGVSSFSNENLVNFGLIM